MRRPGVGGVDVQIGSYVSWQGATWKVAAVSDGAFQLVGGDRVTTVAVNDLAHAIITAIAPLPEGEEEAVALSSVTLSSLSPDEVRRLERLGEAVAQLLADPAPLAPRIEQAAREFGMSVRSLERKVAAYRASGVAGLVNTRATRSRQSRVDPRWDEACVRVLRAYTNASTPTRSAVIAKVAQELDREYGPGAVALPGQTAAYRRLNLLSKGKYTFASAKGRRQVADRPDKPLGRLRADRPGQYVVLDTNHLDVFAMEPVTMRWVPVQLTVAMDLYTRCVLGLRLTPLSTKAADVANVLYQVMTPDTDPVTSQPLPYHGIPDGVLIASEDISARLDAPDRMPVVFPETIVVDRGRQYLSAHVISAAARLGVSVQPANPYKATDKPNIERFFGTLGTGLLQHLPAYKGPDVYSRGKDIEQQAFYFISELEQIIREWVSSVYHHSVHTGLVLPEVPRLALTPMQAYQIGLSRVGGLHLPAGEGLAQELLEVKWRRIHHYGVEVDGLLYDGPALNAYRSVRSSHTGRHAGKWPFHLDVHDVRHLHFRDPAEGTWHKLDWEHAPALDAPFSKDAVEHAKHLASTTGRQIDPAAAVRDLLVRWEKGHVLDRRERHLARRLSSERTHALTEHERIKARHQIDADVPASQVVDFAAQRLARRSGLPADDLDFVDEDVEPYEVIE